MEINYISHCFKRDLPELKLSALYFDKITIPQDIVVGKIEEIENNQHRLSEWVMAIDPQFEKSIKPLMDEGIVIIKDNFKYNPENDNTNDLAKEIIGKNISLFVENEVNVFEKSASIVGSKIQLRDEPFEILLEILKSNKIEKIDTSHLKRVINYYKIHTKNFLRSLNDKNATVTNSEILSCLFRMFSSNSQYKSRLENLKTKSDVNPKLIQEALKLSLPNISSLPMGEILEIRVKLNDELLAFRNYLNVLQYELLKSQSYEDIEVYSKEIISKKIEPSLKDMINKMRSLKYSLISTVIDDIKNPSSYSPFIGSFIEAYPSYLAIILSMGMIGTKTALEWMQELKNVKSNQLYYLMKLKKYNT